MDDDLRGREVAVEDQHVGVALQRAEHHLVELALAEHEASDRPARAPATTASTTSTPGGAGELAQLAERIVARCKCAALRLVADVHEDRAPVLRPTVLRERELAGELVLERAPSARRRRRRSWRVQGDRPDLAARSFPAGFSGEQVRVVERVADAPRRADRVDGGDEVEAQPRSGRRGRRA